MYDKVKFWLDVTIIGEFLPYIVNYLTGVKEQTDKFTGEVKIYGYLQNLRVMICQGGVSITGSLPKYYYPDNLYTLDRKTTKETIQKLCDELHLPVNKAKITSFEFGTHFLVSQPVAAYLKLLGEMPYLRRYQFNNDSLYYQTVGEQKTLNFYDKVKEAKKRKIVLPQCYIDSNLLRYEIRYKRRLLQQLNEPFIIGETLYNEDFYRKMVNIYIDSYFSIRKINSLKSDFMNEIKTPSDGFNLFCAEMIHQLGQDRIMQFIDRLKQNKIYKDPKSYTRLKDKLFGLVNKIDVTETNELISELDNEINNLKAYN